MKKLLSFITLIFLVLIYHTEVISGVRDGLLLWYRTLIPALLPFIIITNALSETHSYDAIASKLQNKIPCIYLLIAILLGNLCGYPIGAKIINDFTKHGYITPRTANSILAVSSQASPMFLLGFVYPVLPKGLIPVHIFLSLIYIPVLLYGTKLLVSGRGINNKAFVSDNRNDINNINDTFLHAASIMIIIGIYVMLFYVILSILIPRSSSTVTKCMLSFMEITTGINLLKSLPLPDKIYTCLVLFLSAFGGLSSAFQIKGVLSYENNSIKKYLPDKIILSAGTLILTYIYLLLNEL